MEVIVMQENLGIMSVPIYWKATLYVDESASECASLLKKNSRSSSIDILAGAI